ncbi:MAG: BACON domain-containing protein [Bacteroidales bacterium]|nr:BACON domain-containing protein [Bacteroidales bacterium]
MVLSNTPTLLEVVAELGLPNESSLLDCINESGEAFVSLLDFAGFQNIFCNAIPSSLTFNSSGGALNVSISSNTTWLASITSGNFFINGDSGAGNDTFTVECFGNSGYQQTGNLRIIWDGGEINISLLQLK